MEHEVDAKALSIACADCLDDLRRLMPQDVKSLMSAQNEVPKKMRELYSRTQICLEILEMKSNPAAAKLRAH